MSELSKSKPNDWPAYRVVVLVDDVTVETSYADSHFKPMEVIALAARRIQGASSVEAIVRLRGQVIAEIQTDAFGNVEASVKQAGSVWHPYGLNGLGELIRLYPQTV